MTVGELIEQLRKLPADASVAAYDASRDDVYAVTEVALDRDMDGDMAVLS
jgi:hypothetical protein